MSGSIDDTFQISQSRLYFLSLNTQPHTLGDKMNHNLLSYRRFDIGNTNLCVVVIIGAPKHADFLSFSVFYNAILVIFTLFIISVIFAVSSPSSSVVLNRRYSRSRNQP
jgi:hypothetical protein